MHGWLLVLALACFVLVMFAALVWALRGIS